LKISKLLLWAYELSFVFWARWTVIEKSFNRLKWHNHYNVINKVAKPDPTRKTRPIRPDPNPIRANFFRKSNWPELDPTWSETIWDPRQSKIGVPEIRPDSNPNHPKSEMIRDQTTRNPTRSEPERPEIRDDPRSHNSRPDPIRT
jgi:hypothetical protein